MGSLPHPCGGCSVNDCFHYKKFHPYVMIKHFLVQFVLATPSCCSSLRRESLFPLCSLPLDAQDCNESSLTVFSFPERNDLTPSAFPHRTGSTVQPTDDLCRPPLDPVQSVSFLNCRIMQMSFLALNIGSSQCHSWLNRAMMHFVSAC